MIRQTFAVGPLACNCTILADERSGDAIVVDGGDGVDDVVSRLSRNGWRAKFLVHTHAHIDHIGDLGRLRELTGGSGLASPGRSAALPDARRCKRAGSDLRSAPPVVALDGELHDGDLLEFGDAALPRAAHARSHARQRLLSRSADGNKHRRCSPATRFLPARSGAGISAARRWKISCVRFAPKLMEYDDATPVVPGHGPFTTIGIERRFEPLPQQWLRRPRASDGSSSGSISIPQRGLRARASRTNCARPVSQQNTRRPKNCT